MDTDTYIHTYTHACRNKNAGEANGGHRGRDMEKKLEEEVT